jgi:Na+-transporting NADH:ubiquinone oxidoreductase subunit C
MKNKAWFNLVFMLICTVVFTGILSGVYVYSRPLIQANARMTEIKAQLNALQAAVPADSSSTELEAYYNKNIERQESNGMTYYSYKDDSGRQYYALHFEGSGLWGKITGIVALDADMKTVTGIDFISQNETPGLGGRIEEDWFKEQFRGIALLEDGDPVRYASSGSGGQVDAITGATITSTAVANMINESIIDAKTKLGGGN